MAARSRETGSYRDAHVLVSELVMEPRRKCFTDVLRDTGKPVWLHARTGIAPRGLPAATDGMAEACADDVRLSMLADGLAEIEHALDI